MIKQKSFVLKPSEAQKKWHVVDAEGQYVGRLATQLADLLRGKLNPKFTYNTDSGDYVVVINADKVKFTGKKWDEKKYHWYGIKIGSLKTRTAKEQLEKRPDLIIYDAVKGMLPKTSLGRKQITKLKVFAGPNHDHEAQKPEKYEIKN